MKIKIISFLVLVISILLFLKTQKSKIEQSLYNDSDLYNNNNTLTINLDETPQVPWNSINASTIVVETFSSSVFGNLIDLEEVKNKRNKFSLVESYSCKDKKCLIKLKDNVKFHNGRIVTAYDVEFSYTRLLMQNKEDNFAFSILDDLEGVESLNKPNYEIKNHLKYPRNILSGIEVISNYQFILHLKRDNQFILQKLSTGFMPIVPIEELDETFINWKGIPVGFGRYKIVKADLKNYQFILENNSHEDIPKYIRIIFSDQDIGDLRILSHMSNSKYDGRISFPNVYVNAGFLFNFNTKIGANENFRKAISLALDREKIANTSVDNELVAEDQMLARYSWQERYRAREDFSKQNINLAKEYMAKVPKSLWENKVFDVHSFWPVKGNLNDTKYIQEIKAQLLEIGLNLKFHNTDFDYTKFKKIDENVLWWTGFDTQTDDPNANFAYFKEGSFFDNIYPNDDTEFLRLYNLSVNNFSKNPEYTRKLSSFFKKNNYMVVVFNIKKRIAYRKNRIEFLKSEYSGVRLDLWKIKLVDFKLF